VAEQPSELPGGDPSLASAHETVNAEVSPALPVISQRAQPVVFGNPTAETRELVQNLVQLQATDGVLTQEQAAEWKENLHKLIMQGAVAVPAVREFLAKNMELDFGEGGSDLFGYATARTAMIDALVKIGGPEAIATMAEALQTTADPREIALLAQGLEKLDPVQHRKEALDAARQTLAMAAEDQLADRDVAPLFEVFQNYGDASAAPDLKNAADRWNYYAVVALAQLPEGAGVPSLIEMVQSMSGPRLNTLELLAQVSSQYPEARAALLDLARADKILSSEWAYLAPMLAGDQYHFQGSVLDNSLPGGVANAATAGHVLSGNQNFYTAPSAGGLTPERAEQQMALIDELGGLTTDPTAVRALQLARDLVSRRITPVLVTSGP